MSTQKEMEEENEDLPKEQIPVDQLPWYETLKKILAPYTPTADKKESTEQFTSKEIIMAIEDHHGIPQGIVGRDIIQFVMPDDFVRAMRELGYHDENAGGLRLEWLMKKK